MTVIAYRDGVLAADSRATYSFRHRSCQKIFRKTLKDDSEVLIALTGEISPALVFIDWYGSGKKKPPDALTTSDPETEGFTCLVVSKGGLHEFDKFCRGEKINEPFWAAGSGAEAALAAMHAGADAVRACEIACLIDPFCALPIVSEKL